MDEQTLEGLRTALSLSPENLALRMVLVRELLARGEGPQAFELLADRDVSALSSDADRVTAGRALLAGGRADLALAVAPDGGAEALLLRARALAAQGSLAEARDAHRRALEENPTLEDAELTALIAGDAAGPPADGERPRLRVISGGGEKDGDLATLLAPKEERVTFADVGGLAEVKALVRRRILLPFEKPTLFARFRRKPGGGILLYGPPGCGKTLLARATAGECGATFLNVAISDVLDMWLGESEAKLHALFEKARASTPSVLFFDELEALGGKRQYSRDAATGKLVSQFLAEMDGFTQGNQGVLVLAATNLPWAVDGAFRRPGRFDRFLFVPPPDREAREAILRIHLRDRPVEGVLDVGALARRTSGFSGADLRSLVETASDVAIEQSLEAAREVGLREEHFKAALAEVKPTTLEWLTTARNHARYANEGGQYDEVLDFLRKHGRD